ncbi:hypothetical protein DLM49_27980 [Streptomyces sp. WAC 01438]|nr:hypothetical protein DLM49_27980 [Streptomyces sp. WAC 01438]
MLLSRSGPQPARCAQLRFVGPAARPAFEDAARRADGGPGAVPGGGRDGKGRRGRLHTAPDCQCRMAGSDTWQRQHRRRPTRPPAPARD